jgi:hypothetical protein
MHLDKSLFVGVLCIAVAGIIVVTGKNGQTANKECCGYYRIEKLFHDKFIFMIYNIDSYLGMKNKQDITVISTAGYAFGFTCG